MRWLFRILLVLWLIAVTPMGALHALTGTTGGVVQNGQVTTSCTSGTPVFVCLLGVSGGQTVNGGTASGNQLTLQSTANATKGGVVIGTNDWLIHNGLSGTPASVAAGWQWYDTAQKSHRLRTTTGTEGLVGQVMSLTADATKATFTGETAVGGGTAFTFPANSMTVGKSVRIHVGGNYSTTATPTVAVSLRWGTTTSTPNIFNMAGVAAANNSSGLKWYLDATLTFRTASASGIYDSTGVAFFPLVSQVNANAVPYANHATAVDTTASSTMTLFWAFGASSASNTVTVEVMTVEVLD